jgi:uncharacterized membrane protein
MDTTTISMAITALLFVVFLLGIAIDNWPLRENWKKWSKCKRKTLGILVLVAFTVSFAQGWLAKRTEKQHRVDMEALIDKLDASAERQEKTHLEFSAVP